MDEILENKIRVFRAEKKISQDELAKAIGVSRQTINSIENMKFVPSAILAMKIAKYFEVKFEDIFYLK